VLVGDQGGAEAARAGAAARDLAGAAVDAVLAANSSAAPRASRRAGTARCRGAGRADSGATPLSTDFSRFDGQGEVDEPIRAAETVAGFLAAASIAVSAVAMVYRPVRLAPVALLVAFLAVALSERHFSRLAAFAVAFGALGWLVGMTIAVLAEEPLY
jgi:hypothetical protein